MSRTIGSWMKKNVIFIGEDATLLEAARVLAKKQIGTLPVVDSGGQLVGITSMRKIVRFFLPDFINVVEDVDFVRDFGAIDIPSPVDIKKAENIAIKEMMDEPVSIEKSSSLMRALAIMITHDLQDLPVVHEGKLVGIASRVDIGRAFLLSWLDDLPKPKRNKRN
ncbi:MAG TPA: CBS domain-containing protein [Anaerolineales bacterium]